MTSSSGSGRHSSREADVAKFVHHVVGNRLKRAGDDRSVKVDLGRERMVVGDGPWVSVSCAFDQYSQSNSSWHKKKLAVDELLSALWGLTGVAKLGDRKFLPKQFLYGPSYDSKRQGE